MMNIFITCFHWVSLSDLEIWSTKNVNTNERTRTQYWWTCPLNMACWLNVIGPSLQINWCKITHQTAHYMYHIQTIDTQTCTLYSNVRVRSCETFHQLSVDLFTLHFSLFLFQYFLANKQTQPIDWIAIEIVVSQCFAQSLLCCATTILLMNPQQE